MKFEEEGSRRTNELISKLGSGVLGPNKEYDNTKADDETNQESDNEAHFTEREKLL